jgi:serine/threonine protein kinase/Tol biopolymer transport system component
MSPLGAGAAIDRYEILNLIGKGAMGEVYRARDQRLGRDVALKVLPAAFSSDPERLQRFDQEARAAGALNHPNVVAIYDVGTHDGTPYVVSELLSGANLRARLDEGSLPPRKLIEIGSQIALGLAAAHAKGIVHRDLKPENLFLLDDGQVKILDFGLAKLIRREPESPGPLDSLVATMTEAGRVLGTVGYMAPEQVRGEAADHRADIFALGCVLFEMATGQAPFRRETSAETMAAIIRDDLPELPAAVTKSAPALGTVIRRCVEKSPGERFQSAKDLAFSLEMLLDPSGMSHSPAAAIAPATEARVSDIKYQRISFRRGFIQTARFTPDGHSVVYSAAWEGKPLELFWSHIGNPEARTLGLSRADLLAVSPANELAVLLRMEWISSFDRSGTLARVPPMGGAPREMLHGVHVADWSPDGSQIAIMRVKEGVARIEFPIGQILYQSPGWVSAMRIHRDGKRIAFVDHPSGISDSGNICVVDRDGTVRTLSSGWGTLRGLAWSADGNEVWFSADREGAARGMYAVNLDGVLRSVLQLASNLTVHDIARDGRVLVAHGSERAGISGLPPGETRERDLSWLDWSLLKDIRADDAMMLFDETAEGGGSQGSVYLRPMDGSPAIRLGDGTGRAISPDGQWVLASRMDAGNLGQLYLLPTGVGEPRDVPLEGLFCHGAGWFSDSRRIVVAASEGSKSSRLWEVDAFSGERRAFSPEGIRTFDTRILPRRDGVLATLGDSGFLFFPLDGGEPRTLPGIERNDRPISWTAEGEGVFVYRSNEFPGYVYRVNLETGDRTRLNALTPPDPTGVYRISRVCMTSDAKTYGYNYYMQLLDLHVVTGLK